MAWIVVGKSRLVGILGVAALSAAALGLSRLPPSQQVNGAGYTYMLPLSADVSSVLLPDGRTFEVHGREGLAYVIGGRAREALPLPEKRQFPSVTVMPSGQVLLWGGIDVRGRLLDVGEWFEPSAGRFVRTGHLGLPVRAGHTLTVLTDGKLLMAGGWTDKGVSAAAVLWDPQTRQAAVQTEDVDVPRLDAIAQLQADGSVRVDGGVDEQGHAVSSSWQYRLHRSPVPVIPWTASIVETLPLAEATAAPIQGPLALRFAVPVDVHQLTPKTVTLLGPEGSVPLHVVGVEGGRLAFVQLSDDLYPGSRYTLFVKGLHTAQGAAVPFTAVGFTTTQMTSAGVVMAGHGARPAPPGADAPMLPPVYLMAGGDAQKPCRNIEQLCRDRSFIRDGAWYPGQDNAPDATGGHWRLYRPHQSLPDTHALEAMQIKGATGLIGQVRQIDETPVSGVEVSVGDIKTRTNARGLFVLTGLSHGRQEVFVDGRTADHGDVHYGRFLVGADIREKAVGHMPFMMYLPRVLPRDEITLPAPTTRELVLTHPDMPGLELHIPANTVFKDREGHVLTHIAIVPTPVDHAPFPLPDNFPMYFTIQPGDAVVQGLTPEAAKGIRVVYPNYGHVTPSTQGNFWVYSVKEGWQMYGTGHVTANARQLAPDPGVSLVWALGAGASFNTAGPPGGRACNGEQRSQPVDLQTGMFFHEWTDLAIHDVIPLELTRAYRSDDNVSHAFGVGGSSNYGIHLYSADSTFTAPQLVMPCGEGIVFNLISGAATWPFPAGTVWEHTGTDSAFYGATLQFLYDSTSDGAHWILTTKDGTQYAFTRHVPNALSWMQDRYGNQASLAYNGGLLDQVSSPSGRSIAFNYDSGNRIAGAVDSTGRTVAYAYNGTGSLATVTYPDQTTEQYTYDGNKRLLTMQDRRGSTWVSNQYDADGRVTRQTLADGTSYQFAYTSDGSGKVTATSVTDPTGSVERVAFDPVSHYSTTDTHAYGTSLAQTTTYQRQPSGLVDAVTDALDRKTAFTYDAFGNITQLTRLAGTAQAVSYQFTYDPTYSQIASMTDPLGHTTSFDYTEGCLSRITDALGHGTTIACNAAGQPVAITDALGHAVTLGYQGGDLQSVTDALGHTTTYVTDSLGRRVAARDPLGNVTLAAYDVDDRVTEMVDGLNQTTLISYDGNGNPLSVTLPGGAVIHTAYDSLNRPITRTDALQQAQSWTYDGLGHVLSATDRKGQATLYSYDALGRQTVVSYADGSGTQASYDAGNRLTEMLDTGTGSLSWGYDDLDRPTTAVTPQGTLTYSYDAAGRRTGLTAAAQAIVNYVYDAADRLTSLSQGSETVRFAYDAANRRTALTLPNGIAVAYGYDAADQVTTLDYTQPNGTALGHLTYGHDAAGRLISQGGTLAPDVLPTPTSQAGTFDLNNRQNQFNGLPLSYDANGDLTGDGPNTYVWNARHQLTTIQQGSTVQASFTYDALGRRTAKTLNGVATQYLYDGLNAVQETQGGTVNPILAGPGIDERFARNDVTGRTYFLADALGSTIGLTGTTGALVQQYQYDPYGNATQTNTTTGFTNPYLYTGREADSAGLYYYRARYYSPLLGRFISEDPLGLAAGPNGYAYVGGDPLNSVDPYGLAQFGFRPLGDAITPFAVGKAPSSPSRFDLNVAHEDLWFDDVPSDNIGFFAGNGSKPGWKICGEAGVVRADVGHDRSQYSFFGPKYDDEIMRQAVANVMPNWNNHAYCLAGHNCQTFSDALRAEYQRLVSHGTGTWSRGSSGSW